MSRTALVKSLALWTRRAAYRRKKWLEHRKKRDRAHTGTARWNDENELRAHWLKLYQQAKSMVVTRGKQLVSLKPRAMSPKGVDFLIREEGSVPYAYKDPAGHATFGVGHLLHLGPVTQADRNKWGTKTHPSSHDLVVSVLEKDLHDRYERAVKDATGGKLTKPWQFDAATSLAFNIGTAGFRNSTVAREIRAGHLQKAADAFRMWDKPAMLKPRRERERRLFLTGQYK